MTSNIIAFPAKDTEIEILVGIDADTHRLEFLVAVNEPGEFFIYWDGTSYAEARKVACELLAEVGGRIVDRTCVRGGRSLH
jgi:hypothetical protein